MRYLSVSLVPNLGKTTQSPQSDLTSWILTLRVTDSIRIQTHYESIDLIGHCALYSSKTKVSRKKENYLF